MAGMRLTQKMDFFILFCEQTRFAHIPDAERSMIMLIKRCLAAFILVSAGLMMTAAVFAAETDRSFRQQNGLIPHAPPAWFLEGYFIAREKGPGYVFGPVRDFAGTLGGTASWLIEDMELKRLEQASSGGKEPEFSLFLEVFSPERAEYWIFVVLPYDSSRDWFDARRAYHGRKADSYYGETQNEIERAISQGLKIKAELRFFIDQGQTCLQAPEEVIMNRYGMHPVFDLKAGCMLKPSATTDRLIQGGKNNVIPSK